MAAKQPCLLVPFIVEDMYKGWLDAGGSGVGEVIHGKPFRTGFSSVAIELPSAVCILSATYRPKGGYELSDIAY